MKKYFKLMRIKHYVKNFLIFMPIIFALKITDKTLLASTILGFVTFSLLASSIYIFNDIIDVDKDRLHNVKKFRPIASGEVSIRNAYLFSSILLIFCFSINLVFISSKLSVIILIIYFILNLLYSKWLKNLPLVDVVVVVSGFVLRLMYGGLITGIDISSWLYLTVISFSFYLALGKRRNEIKMSGSSTRYVLSHYNEQFLDKIMYMCLGLSIVYYSLWCINSIENNKYLIWTVPLVIIICMKYSMNIEGDSHGDPAEVIFGDKSLLTLIIIYGVTIVSIVYSSMII